MKSAALLRTLAALVTLLLIGWVVVLVGGAAGLGVVKMRLARPTKAWQYASVLTMFLRP